MPHSDQGPPEYDNGDNEILSIVGTIAGGFTVLLGTAEADDGQGGNETRQMLLEQRDRITVKNAVFEDAAGNRNRSVSATAVLPPMNPRITSVRMSNVHHITNMAVRIKDEVAGTNSNLWIAALPEGTAAGTAGNEEPRGSSHPRYCLAVAGGVGCAGRTVRRIRVLAHSAVTTIAAAVLGRRPGRCLCRGTMRARVGRPRPLSGNRLR